MHSMDIYDPLEQWQGRDRYEEKMLTDTIIYYSTKSKILLFPKTYHYFRYTKKEIMQIKAWQNPF